MFRLAVPGSVTMDGNEMPEPARSIPEAFIATRFTTFVTLDVEAVETGLVNGFGVCRGV